MQRFQLISYPDITQEFKDVEVLIPQELKNEIKQLAIDLDSICFGKTILHFDAIAQKAFVEWYVAHQNKTRAEEAEHWQSHLGKVPKLVGSLCIQLHLLENIKSNLPAVEISLSSLKKALLLADYYIEHARRAYGSIESRVLEDARKIFKMIRSGKIKSRFKASDIYRNCSCSLSESDRTKAALDLLNDHNIVAMEKQKAISSRNWKCQRYALIAEATAKLKTNTVKAADALAELLESNNEMVKRGAANDILNNVSRFKEIVEFEERLSKLERTSEG